MLIFVPCPCSERSAPLRSAQAVVAKPSKPSGSKLPSRGKKTPKNSPRWIHRERKRCRALFGRSSALSLSPPGPQSLRSGSLKTSKIVAVAQTKLTFIRPTQSGTLKRGKSHDLMGFPPPP